MLNEKRAGMPMPKERPMPIEDDELDAVAVESSHTIDIDSVVPESEVDVRSHAISRPI